MATAEGGSGRPMGGAPAGGAAGEPYPPPRRLPPYPFSPSLPLAPGRRGSEG